MLQFKPKIGKGINFIMNLKWVVSIIILRLKKFFVFNYLVKQSWCLSLCQYEFCVANSCFQIIIFFYFWVTNFNTIIKSPILTVTRSLYYDSNTYQMNLWNIKNMGFQLNMSRRNKIDVTWSRIVINLIGKNWIT